MQNHLLTLLLLTPLASALISLTFPPSLPSLHNSSSQSPCGGATILFQPTDSLVTASSISSAPIVLNITARQGSFVIRGTTSQAAPYNWTTLWQPVFVRGAGEICLPAVPVPAEWAGSAGIVQVVSREGEWAERVSFKCAAVKFVAEGLVPDRRECFNNTEVESIRFSNASFVVPGEEGEEPIIYRNGLSGTSTAVETTRSPSSQATRSEEVSSTLSSASPEPTPASTGSEATLASIGLAAQASTGILMAGVGMVVAGLAIL